MPSPDAFTLGALWLGTAFQAPPAAPDPRAAPDPMALTAAAPDAGTQTHSGSGAPPAPRTVTPPKSPTAEPVHTAHHEGVGTAEHGDAHGAEGDHDGDEAHAEDDKPRRKILDWDPERGPAGKRAGEFFDPGRLEEGPGAVVNLRGYMSGGFFVTQRSNVFEQDDAGRYADLPALPFFGGGNAALFVGSEIFEDVASVRLTLEYISIPVITAGEPDILAPARRQLLIETSAVEVNPFFWAKRSPDWFQSGFKITAGVFMVPFGVEDEDHAAPVNWFSTRPRSMSTMRIYPGTWSDVGVALKWKPRFGGKRSVRPLEIDVAMINGDPCTQTRFMDTLYRPSGLAAPCERVLRPDETRTADAGPYPPVRVDGGFLGLVPDNNRNKGVASRLRVFPVPSIDLGGSFVWGKHPDGAGIITAGEGPADLDQAPTWRVGAHAVFEFDDMFDTRVPLPTLRAEFVMGVDRAVDRDDPTLADRRMIGGYAQIAQPLYRRKRTHLPGLMVLYRFDHADPDRDVPGVVGGVPLQSRFDDPFLYDEAIQAHTIALLLPVVPRLTLKAEYSFLFEDGGTENQLANDFFAAQIVGDF